MSIEIVNTLKSPLVLRNYGQTETKRFQCYVQLFEINREHTVQGYINKIIPDRKSCAMSEIVLIFVQNASIREWLSALPLRPEAELGHLTPNPLVSPAPSPAAVFHLLF